MIRLVIRLEFDHVFSDEEKKSAKEYLLNVSKETLLKCIGFFNTKPLPNFDGWFSNPDLQQDLVIRVVNYLQKFPTPSPPEICSPDSCLKIAEIVLSNYEEFLKNNSLAPDPDRDETNLLKAFLILNEEFNQRNNYDNTSENNLDKLVDLSIIFSFTLSDLPAYQNDNYEFAKLVYATIVKISCLLDFLDSNPEYKTLKNHLFNSFNVPNRAEFNKQYKYLFGMLFKMKSENVYRFKVDDVEASSFLDSLLANDAVTDQDFTFLKINPVFKVEEGVYAFVHYFFVVDKFFRGVKFMLKEAYENDPTLREKYGNFFSFYNKKFSEEYLMRGVLDDIFDKPHFFKLQPQAVEAPGEPDYYLRIGNKAFVFENKDVMIAQGIKASADKDQIEQVLKDKFLEHNGRRVGIGQLINTIESMKDGTFQHDPYIKGRNGLSIYPILLVHDRIFQSLGINYRLDEFYRDEISKRLGSDYDPSKIKNLVVIDIDTLIVLRAHFKARDRNFRDLLDVQIRAMNAPIKVSIPNREKAIRMVNKKLTNRIRPIAYRDIPFKFNVRDVVDLFRDVLKDDEKKE